MKRIINGKKYDTDTAEHVASDCGTMPGIEWRNNLYKKKTGEFFYHFIKITRWQGEENVDELTPIDEEKAREFCEKNLDTDKYEALFGIVQE